jgi:hypothetical protein
MLARIEAAPVGSGLGVLVLWWAGGVAFSPQVIVPPQLFAGDRYRGRENPATPAWNVERRSLGLCAGWAGWAGLGARRAGSMNVIAIFRQLCSRSCKKHHVRRARGLHFAFVMVPPRADLVHHLVPCANELRS